MHNIQRLIQLQEMFDPFGNTFELLTMVPPKLRSTTTCKFHLAQAVNLPELRSAIQMSFEHMLLNEKREH